MLKPRGRGAFLVILTAAWLAGAPARAGGDAADVAIVHAVDVSGSVDAERYALQMQGIARTFEDPAVQQAILAGPKGAIYVALVEWSNKAQLTLPWRRIASAADAEALAGDIRRASRADEQFTCMSLALQTIADKVLPFLPGKVERRVIDVSGDGHDNCNPPKPVSAMRDELVRDGVTINGLPILEGDEAVTLAPWYRDNVIGGAGAFLTPAAGFADFERAMRQKFVIEVSRAGAAADPDTAP
jgi:hypothetical protein